MVEADNANEAMRIATNCSECEISWTDGWTASDAEQVASKREELGDDADLAITDPYIKAKMTAEECGYLSYPATNGRLYLTPCGANNIVTPIDMKEMLEELDHDVEIIDKGLLVRPSGSCSCRLEEANG